MCKLCDVIYDSENDYINTLESHCDEKMALVKNYKGKIGIYIPNEDDYFSMSHLFGIKCCPMCGENFIEGENNENNENSEINYVEVEEIE